MPGNPQSPGANITSLQSQLFQNGPNGMTEKTWKNRALEHLEVISRCEKRSDGLWSYVRISSFGHVKNWLKLRAKSCLGCSTSPHCPVGCMIAWVKTIVEVQDQLSTRMTASNSLVALDFNTYTPSPVDRQPSHDQLLHRKSWRNHEATKP